MSSPGDGRGTNERPGKCPSPDHGVITDSPWKWSHVGQLSPDAGPDKISDSIILRHSVTEAGCTMCLKTVQQGEARRRAVLVLEDGTRFPGYSFGAEVSVGGEIGTTLLFNE